MRETGRAGFAPPAGPEWRDDASGARELPCCSVRGCRNAAGAVIRDTLLCGEHANEVFAGRNGRATGR